jgi:hypothetical protein
MAQVVNHVRLIRHIEQSATVLAPGRYEFNENGRLPWLQKLLFAILRRLRADSYDTKVNYTTVEVDTGKILDAVMQNACDAESLYFQRAKYIVMGPSDFARFTSEGPKSGLYADFMQFSFDARLGYGRTVTVFGLECVVVPWIEGFFVMPDLQQ